MSFETQIVWTPNGSADAFDVAVRSNESTLIRLKAPADAPTEPGPWNDFGGLTDTVLTEDLSSTIYLDGFTDGDPDTAVGDPDAGTTIDYFTSSPSAWISTYPAQTPPNEQYYGVGLTTLSAAGILTGGVSALPTPLPNQYGPETSGDVTGFTWSIHGQVIYLALSELDSTADQLTDTVLKYAIVPASLVEANTVNGTLQHQWITYPTRDVLDGLTLLGSMTPPVAAPGDWVSGGSLRQANVSFTLDIDVPSSAIVDGAVYIGYWLERVSQVDRTFSTTYSTYYSVVRDRSSWIATADGPLVYPMTSSSDTQDPSLAHLSWYGNNEADCGYWQKSGEEIWLAAAGSYAGGRTVQAINAFGFFSSGPLVNRWVFSQVNTTDFGVVIAHQLGTRVLVITPTQALDVQASGTTVVATHSTAFSAGDQVDAVITFDRPDYYSAGAVPTATIYRNGVQVSTFTWPSGYSYGDQFYSPVPWALAANSGNRVSTLEITTIPTNVGAVSVEVDFDYGDTVTPTPSSFQADAGSAVQYRWLYPIGYPKAVIDPDDVSTSQRVKMWLRLGLDTDVGMLWHSQVSPEATDTPEVPPSDWSQMVEVASDFLARRPDGELYAGLGNTVFDSSAQQNQIPALYNDDVTRMTWVDDFTVYLHEPFDTLMVSKHMDLYWCIDLDTYVAGGQDWWGDTWPDLWLFLHPRGRLPAPKVWHWGPDDDHGGLQYEGYTHDPVQMNPPPSTVKNGMAIRVEDSNEDWIYQYRDVIIGYTDEDGPFVYSAVNSWNNQYGGFTIWDQTGYSIGTSDDLGNLFAWAFYDQAWYSQRAVIYPLGGADWRAGKFLSNTWTTPTRSKEGTQLNFASDVTWAYDSSTSTPGIYTTAGPTTADSLYLFNPRNGNVPTAHGDPLTLDVEYSVGSDDGGVFVRAVVRDDGTEEYYKVSQSQIIRVVNSVETVLDSWSSHTKFKIIVNGDTITVKDGSGTTLSTVSAPRNYDTMTANVNFGIFQFGIWSRRTSGDAMRVSRLWATSTDFATDRTYRVDAAGQTEMAAWSIMPGADSFGELRGQVIRGEVGWNAPTEPPDFDDAKWNVGWVGGPDVPQHLIMWMVWLPAYPDSLFIQVDTDGAAFPPTVSTLHLYEVDKWTGSVIAEHAPFYDTGVYPDMDQVAASGNGTKILMVSTYNPASGTQAHLLEYDPATDTVTVLNAIPAGHSVAFVGVLPDGRRLFGGVGIDRWSIYDPGDDTWLDIAFEPYAGKGFNGGLIGWDGGWHIWGGQLNYHVLPRTYKLSAAEVAGTDTPAGTIVNLGNGEAKFFTEFYKYNVRDAGTVETDSNLFPDPSGGVGFALYWEDHTTCTGTSLGPLTGEVRFEAVPDVLGLATNTATEIGSDTAYDIRMSTSTTEVVGLPTSISKLFLSADMSSYGLASWGRLEITQYDSSMSVVSVDSGAINSELLTSNQGYYDSGDVIWETIGFESTLELQTPKHALADYASFAFTFRVIPGTEEEPPDYNGAPYGRVRNVIVRGNDGAIPIEYAFNIDPIEPQTYCDVVKKDGTVWESWGRGIQYQYPVCAWPATFSPQRGWTIGTVGVEGSRRFVRGTWIGEASEGLGTLTTGTASCFASDGTMSVGNYDHPYGADQGGAEGPGASYSNVGWYPSAANPAQCAWNNGTVGVAQYTISAATLASYAAAVGADPANIHHWVARLTPGTQDVDPLYALDFTSHTGAYRLVGQIPFDSLTVKDIRDDPDPDSFMSNLTTKVYNVDPTATFTSSNSDASSSAVVASAPISGIVNGFLSIRGYYTDILSAISGGNHLGDVAIGGTSPAPKTFTVPDRLVGTDHVVTIAIAHSSAVDFASTTPAMAFPDWTATSVCTTTPNFVYRRHLYFLPSLNVAPVFSI